MVGVSVAIMARNNEDEIADCLQSVAWADECIILLDTRSTDRTAAIAQAMGARVVPHPFEDFARQREFGLSLPRNAWLFYVDSDERATPALAQEIRQVIQDETYAGWWVPRRNYIWGREIKHGGWYPDYQLRLLKLGRAHYDLTRPVHEIVILDGQENHLREALVHHNYRTIGQFIAKQRQYVAYEAQILYQEGIRPRLRSYLSRPLREFWRRYIALQGYKDGVHGFLLCALVAYYYGFRVTVELRRLWGRAA